MKFFKHILNLGVMLLCITHFSFAQQAEGKKGTFSISKPDTSIKGYNISYYNAFEDQYNSIPYSKSDTLFDKITPNYVSMSCSIDEKAAISIVSTSSNNCSPLLYDKAIELVKSFAIPGMDKLYINQPYIITIYF